MDSENSLHNIVMRQTDYDEEQAKNKLNEHNNDVLAVIKEYLGPKKNVDTNKCKSINQMIYGEIRTLMDDAAATYRVKKELEERKQQAIQRALRERSEAETKLKENLK